MKFKCNEHGNLILRVTVINSICVHDGKNKYIKL